MIYKFQNSGVMPQVDATSVVMPPREYKRTTIHQDHDALVKWNLEHPNDKVYRIEDLIQKEKEANPSWVKRAANLAVNPVPTSNFGMMSVPNPDSPVRSTVKDELGVAMTAASVPMIASEIGIYGGLGAGLRLGAGSAAAAGTSYVGGKAGDWLDNKLGTNWIGDTNRLVLPFITFPVGMKGANSILRSAAGHGITMGMPQETFNALRSSYFTNRFNKINHLKIIPNKGWDNFSNLDVYKDTFYNHPAIETTEPVTDVPNIPGIKVGNPKDIAKLRVSPSSAMETGYIDFFDESKPFRRDLRKIYDIVRDGTSYHFGHPLKEGVVYRTRDGYEFLEYPRGSNTRYYTGKIKTEGYTPTLVHEGEPNMKGTMQLPRPDPFKRNSEDYLWWQRNSPWVRYTKGKTVRINDAIPTKAAWGSDYTNPIRLSGSFDLSDPNLNATMMEYNPLTKAWARVKYHFPKSTVSPQEAATTYHFDGRMSFTKPISEAEKLGIPKGERSNPKALEDPYYWGYQQWNQRYFDALNRGDYPEVQRIRDLHFKIKAPNTKVIDENGNLIHMYHGIRPKVKTVGTKVPGSKYYDDYIHWHKPIRFTQFRYINFDLEDLAEASKRNWVSMKNVVPNNDTMNGYHTKDYKQALGYAWGDRSGVLDNYLNIEKPFTWNEQALKNITGRKEVSDWADFGWDRKLLMKLGYDGLFIPQYYDSYGVFNSPAQIKSADPITYNGFGEIIPIVKRDNFHNLDMRYKKGGTIKLQAGGIDFNKNWYTQRKKLLGDNAKQYGRNVVFPEFTGMKKGVLPRPLTNKPLDLNLSTDKLAELELKRIFKNLNNVKVYNNNMLSDSGGYYTTLTHTYNLNPKLDNKTKGYVDIHESNHAANLTAQQEAIRQYIDSHKNTYLRKGNTYDDYLDIPDEILSRRQEFVKEWNVDPTSKHELKDIRNLNFWPNKSQSEIIENVTSPKRGANKNFLLRYSPEFIQFLLNDVADNNQRVINPNISRKGGKI